MISIADDTIEIEVNEYEFCDISGIWIEVNANGLSVAATNIFEPESGIGRDQIVLHSQLTSDCRENLIERILDYADLMRL